MKNFKNDLANKNYNSNRKPHYKAISLASLSALTLTLTLGDVSTANAMMTKSGAVKFYGSNGVKTITGVHNKISSTIKPSSIPKVTGDIAGRFTNTSKIGTTSTTTSKTTSTIKTYKSTLNINLKGNTSGLGSSSSSTKKPTTTTINKNTSSLQQNTGSSSTTGKKPTTTTTQLGSDVKYAKDGTPYFTTQDGENYIYVKNSSGLTKINMDFDGDGNAIYYTKNASGGKTYLQKVGQDNGEPDFRPTTNNKPVVSVGTQTDPDITGVNTNTLTSKKPNTTNQSNSNDGKYNATLVELDDDGNIIQQNNAGSSILKPTTGKQQSSTQINDDVDGINNNTLVSKKPTTTTGQLGDDDIDVGNKNTLTSKKPITTTNQFDDNGSIKNNTLQIKDDGDGQPNNAGATTVQTGTGSGNKKLTKKQKVTLGVLGGIAGLGTIVGLSAGLASNNSGDKKDEGTPPKLVPVPNAPKHSISVVSSPEGNLFTDN